jgi:hypothetical protein
VSHGRADLLLPCCIPVSLLTTLASRVYQDFLMGDRLDAYAKLLKHIRESGYAFWTVPEFAAAVSQGATPGPRVCVLRVDVDSDTKGAAKMFARERECGARATYYFRLKTLAPEFAREIRASGSEAGYHFEEIATVAKRLGLTTQAEIDEHLELIRDEFRRNIAHFAKECGSQPRTVTAHGDFANRRLGISNSHLLTQSLMDELGIVSDVHDPRVYAALATRFLDQPAPIWWQPGDPVQLLATDKPATILVLVHPRQWTCNPVANLKSDLARAHEELAYRRRSRTSLAVRAKAQSSNTSA